MPVQTFVYEKNGLELYRRFRPLSGSLKVQIVCQEP